MFSTADWCGGQDEQRREVSFFHGGERTDSSSTAASRQLSCCCFFHVMHDEATEVGGERQEKISLEMHASYVDYITCGRHPPLLQSNHAKLGVSPHVEPVGYIATTRHVTCHREG